MKKITGGCLILAIAMAGLCAFSSMAWAVDNVICVPWQGDPLKQHTAISGQAVTLKAVVKTDSTAQRWYQWVFGDGSPSTAILSFTGANKYNVAISHTYTAANGTPFTATLMVSKFSDMSAAVSGNYLLKIEANNLDSKINLAIDNGLWWLYNNNYTDSCIQAYNGQPVMAWWNSCNVGVFVAPTASAIQAFAINNHKYHGDPSKDPYVEAVQMGINWLVNGHYSCYGRPMLYAVSIGPVNRGGGLFDDPEAGQTAPNLLGVEVYDYSSTDRTPYQGGQAMDAIIAAGVLPTDLTGRDFTRTDGTIGHNWTFQELLQDMADMYAWGQWDGGGCNGGICGSWWYNWNYSSPGDNSASQWGTIGMTPAQQAPWNVKVPQWVKTYNANWLEYSYCAAGAYFGYNGGCGSYNDGALNTTPSGMIQMAFDGQTSADAKWIAAQKMMADNWYILLDAGSNSWGGNRTYGWYAMAKAMRLALPSAITTITKTNGNSFDWYRGGSNFVYGDAGYNKGLAERIVEVQSADGHWDGELTCSSLTTPWMIITLRPVLFQAAPSACFSAHPNPDYANSPINFDPSCSAPSDPSLTLTKFEWDWNNDGVFDQSTSAPTVVQHSFACASLPCLYPVTLRVTDNSTPTNLTATTVLDITISTPPFPPVANAGGPYMVSLCPTDTLKLDGSQSTDPDAGVKEVGCQACPVDAIIAYDWDLVPPLTDFTDKTGAVPVVTLSHAEVASFFTAGSHNIGLRVTDNTSLAFPSSGQPNLTDANFTTVQVYNACICDLAAQVKSGKVQLVWQPTGAASYNIYRSTTGPNTGFALIKSGLVTSYATYLDTAVVNNNTYWYRVVSSDGCGSKAISAKPAGR